MKEKIHHCIYYTIALIYKFAETNWCNFQLRKRIFIMVNKALIGHYEVRFFNYNLIRKGKAECSYWITKVW